MTRLCHLLVWTFIVSCSCLSPATAQQPRPNIVFLFADDLGYGDIGAFGQTKIHTPNLDQLAKSGMRLTQCYAGNAVCAPSRCVLMTGMHPGHAQVRNNREVKPEGQHPLTAGTATLPRLLKQLGYTTGGFGKWGLGGPDSDGRPTKQGIDEKFPLNNPPLTGHEKLPAGADPNDERSYAGLAGAEYGMDVITDQAVKFVHDNKDKPFFLYFPSIIPHFALQGPEDSLVEYKGKFPDAPYTGNYTANRTPRATYAAMVTRLDKHAGMIIKAVRDLGLEENTIFIFTSDNGPVFDSLSGDRGYFFNSASGLRGRKGTLWEGGIREPTIVSWKGHIAPGTTSDRVIGFEDWLPTLLELAGGKAETPKDTDGISFAPTLLGQQQQPRPFLYREFAPGGGQQMVRIGDWKGVRMGMQPGAGKGKAKAKAAEKATAKANPASPPNLKIQLYNLKTDRAETTDVADQHPDIVAQIKKIMRDQHTPNPEFPLPGIDG